MKRSPVDIKEIVDRARAMQTPAERKAYLDLACAGTPEVRVRIEAMLNPDEDPAGRATTVEPQTNAPGSRAAEFA